MLAASSSTETVPVSSGAWSGSVKNSAAPLGPMLRPDAALVGCDDFTADRQPKPGAARPVLVRLDCTN